MSHAAADTLPGPDNQFSTEQAESFHADDRTAAGWMIVLMTAIFTLGLTGASIVCLAVMS